MIAMSMTRELLHDDAAAAHGRACGQQAVLGVRASSMCGCEVAMDDLYSHTSLSHLPLLGRGDELRSVLQPDYID